jgi:hypothetical protein
LERRLEVIAREVRLLGREQYESCDDADGGYAGYAYLKI